MHYTVALLSVVVIFLLALLVSSNRSGIRFRPLAVMLIVQLVLAFALLNTSAGAVFIGGFANAFAKLLSYAADGVNFVFGGIVKPGTFVFLFNVLMPIVFVSALIGILQYISVLQWFMRIVGWLLSKITGMGKLESYNGIASLILGQSEVFISMKKQLDYLTPQRLYTLNASAISTVSMSIVGSYMQIIDPRYVVTAVALNMFGGFMIASIINPYTVPEEEDLLELENPRKQHFFDMLGEYLIDGFKIAVIVAVMVMGYVALIAMINGVFDGLFGMTFEHLAGYAFSPLALLMGVPFSDAIQVGGIMAVKTLSNEFVAMLQLQHLNELSPRSIGITSVFLVSFANFSSVGIIAGAIKALSDKQAVEVARSGLKLLYGAMLVSLLSATIAGLFI